LDNFDEDVHARFKVCRKEAYSVLSQREQWLLSLTRQELDDEAVFDPKKPRFFYTGSHARIGNYYLDWRDAQRNAGNFYRADHPLAVRLIDTAAAVSKKPCRIPPKEYPTYRHKRLAAPPALGGVAEGGSGIVGRQLKMTIQCATRTIQPNLRNCREELARQSHQKMWKARLRTRFRGSFPFVERATAVPSDGFTRHSVGQSIG
jgi:hypothetical protein